MKWEGERESDNVEDQRGSGPASGFTPGGGGGGGLLNLLPTVLSLLGIKGTIIVVLAFVGYNLLTGGNLGSLFGTAPPPTSTAKVQEDGGEKRLVEFVSVVLASTEDTWGALFSQAGKTYVRPKLVLFRHSVNSACGMADAAVGPFYCPGDQKLYIDLSFYQELKDRFHAPGEFAEAYVIAHEVGHHVQTLLGVSSKVAHLRQGLDKVGVNHLSVEQELQADCFAGIWAYHADHAKHFLEAGDVETALTAATAIGDDRLQKQARGTVNPDSFTHGTSEQRVRWFTTGLKTGSLEACDTFKAQTL